MNTTSSVLLDCTVESNKAIYISIFANKNIFIYHLKKGEKMKRLHEQGELVAIVKSRGEIEEEIEAYEKAH